ncbi:hypothetical protein IBL28_14305 [Sinomicrobium sp. FJxs]|uniref:Uncharacterized protein n=1 Tax=Sinomicrobium weinanense TaxID=2842200 RepID=A0A926JTL6_9FLAO|nr:hypothetical protein [Sinomicrobium weinanense]MBU3124487.1 hypothetical protein [Sinomicrobium weinanense]
MLAMTRPVMPVLDYLINEDYIAEYFCVNKERPELKCNGQCYLAKLLEKQQQNKKEGIPPIQLKEYPIGFVDILEIPASVSSRDKKHQIEHINHYTREINFSIFHPPSFLG